MLLSKYKKIVFDYELAPSTNVSRALIILGGIPGEPKTYPHLNELVSKGYSVFYPHYEGTWDSEGEFLERSPAESINEFIDYLHDGASLDGNSIKIDEIYIISSSFGAAISLSLKDKDYIRKICAMSPVVSFKQVNGINTLEAHILKDYSIGYRFTHENWKKLINDELIYPLNHTEISPNKIMVIAGKNDKQINVEDLSKYAEKYSINYFFVKEKNHITPSKIDEDLLNEITDFFEKTT